MPPLLAKHLRQAIDEARYPLAPRLDPLKAILSKLETPKAETRTLTRLNPAWGRAFGAGGGDDEIWECFRLRKPLAAFLLLDLY